ncbi:hypothetical protein ACQPZG_00345 (plasmid) [Streptomyces sp. CA-294286]|uniref:hypothetical protein n=1 Tax=Streptomyces sp. CA-294286 TaxID=3240070 RepID=UPI003D8A4229
MTVWKFPPVPSVDGWLDADPYRYPGAATTDSLPGAGCGPVERDSSLLSAADTGRLSARFEPAAHRRLDLLAALTRAGVAPAPGDAEALDVLSTLDDSTCAVLLRWIHRIW